MTESRIKLLQAMPVFGGINEDILNFLVSQAKAVTVAQGQYFFREGESGESMYVLQKGKVAVVKTWQGHHHVLRQLSYGDSFGEMALIDLFPRSASVRAIQTSQAIELTNALLLDVYERDLEQFTMIQMNMGREISRRLRKADDLLFKAKAQYSILEDEHSHHTF
jgi:CRP-like cAMP-binding protein